MGGGGKKGGDSNPATDAQVKMAQQLFQQSDPVRQKLFGRSTDFLAGNEDVTQTPAYGALKLNADQNFNQAKDNIIGSAAPGGALTDALTNLEGSRATTLTQGAGGLYGDELARAMTLGTGFTGQSLSSLGQAGANQAQMAANQAQVQSAKYNSFGQAAGAAYGAK